MATGFNSIGHGETPENVVDVTVVLPTIEERRKAASERLDRVQEYLARLKRDRALAETVILPPGAAEAGQPLPQVEEVREQTQSALEK